jgi:hypothetical protein
MFAGEPKQTTRTKIRRSAAIQEQSGQSIDDGDALMR